MLLSRHATNSVGQAAYTTTTTHICLSCRLRAKQQQQQQRHVPRRKQHSGNPLWPFESGTAEPSQRRTGITDRTITVKNAAGSTRTRNLDTREDREHDESLLLSRKAPASTHRPVSILSRRRLQLEPRDEPRRLEVEERARNREQAVDARVQELKEPLSNGDYSVNLLELQLDAQAEARLETQSSSRGESDRLGSTPRISKHVAADRHLYRPVLGGTLSKFRIRRQTVGQFRRRRHAVDRLVTRSVEHDAMKRVLNEIDGIVAATAALDEDVEQKAQLTTYSPFPPSKAKVEDSIQDQQEQGEIPTTQLTHSLEATNKTRDSNSGRPRTAAINYARFAWQKASMSTFLPGSCKPFGAHARLYHSSPRSWQQRAVTQAGNEADSYAESFLPVENRFVKLHGIRAQLRQWQELHGHEDPQPLLNMKEDGVDDEEATNNLTRLPGEDTLNESAKLEEEEHDRLVFFSNSSRGGYDGTSKEKTRFLRAGDLVEIEFMKSERESFLAVFVRTLETGLGQFFTMSGRWMLLNEKHVPYSIPGWISAMELEPLLEHLPTLASAAEQEELAARAYHEDLSVPRHVAAPVVAKLLTFYKEAQETYRRHASALDDAHNILAHETDLRYGSLLSAATALLKIPTETLPLTALFTVRKALANGGFAFNIDRRSHRHTGYMQIRSKEQVKSVEQVRNWIRHWQEDLAACASLDQEQVKRHKSPKGARVIYGFIEKARAIIIKQRANRQPTTSNCVGPSSVRIPISRTSDSVKIETEFQFTDEEQEIVRFLESWCCSGMFMGLSRIESLPPLLLHATGMYEELDGVEYKDALGYMFLQELGTLLPYENKVRFDQHLLLPSSQHSKPLQNLMQSLLDMRDSHNFHDSMAELRHDWGSLPVYCVDEASAQEIDDGISIEHAGYTNDGERLHWLHIHIANPTAFFSRDHPLAKMARHMGETIYMPERTYMMLPRWATQRHFSLGPNRPCLTFSAKMDSTGKVLDQKVVPGHIRNVFRITYKELTKILGGSEMSPPEELTLSVGGETPPARAHKSQVSGLGDANIDELKSIMHLSLKRSETRKLGGGLFFEQSKPDVQVWQGVRGTGLAWDHPHRKGSRTVFGDPVIQVTTAPTQNWFAASRGSANIFVSEAMLLCSEIAARYCADRKIPIIYRGTARDDVHRNRLGPKVDDAIECINAGKDLPMYLGVPYLQSLGYTVLRTEPIKHQVLGMDYYSKVTSPLRRYGDMILHWQIEAALRHEAETGKSMVVQPDQDTSRLDRTFLPFSAPVLDTIMLGLQPRETMIMRAKAASQDFWINMLIFRRHLCGEDGGLPFADKMHVFLHSPPAMRAVTRRPAIGCVCVELNWSVSMLDPLELGLEEAEQGDLWEVKIAQVDVYRRATYVTPLRLVSRCAM